MTGAPGPGGLPPIKYHMSHSGARYPGGYKQVEVATIFDHMSLLKACASTGPQLSLSLLNYVRLWIYMDYRLPLILFFFLGGGGGNKVNTCTLIRRVSYINSIIAIYLLRNVCLVAKCSCFSN